MKHQKLSTTLEISKRMAHIHLRGGESEEALAKALWKKGFRYRKNYKKLPGSPDIAILKYHIAVFIDGEFWHGKDWNQKKNKLISNKNYWIEKIEENIARDQRNDLLLADLGWKPIHFWEKEVRKSLPNCIERVISVLPNRDGE